jgi:hypothetical protein
MKTWSTERISSLYKIPFPSDAPKGLVVGPETIRILLLGNGLAHGWGVLSHNLAFPGQIARGIAFRTGQGAEVDLLTATRLKDLIPIVRSHQTDGYDAIVIQCSAEEALALKPPDQWRFYLAELLETLTRQSKRSIPIVIASVQPIHTIPIFRGPLGRIAERHVTFLNRVTGELSESYPNVRFVKTEAPSSTECVGRYRSADQYRIWAQPLALSIIEVRDLLLERSSR